MNHVNYTPVAPSTSSLNPFHIIGGIFSDVVEGLQYLGREASDVPQALADGFNNGCIIDTDNSEALKAQANSQQNTIITPVAACKTEIVTPVSKDDKIAALQAQIAELQATKPTVDMSAHNV